MCEDCSSKRVSDNGEEHRVSDGQFLLAKTECKKAKELEMEQRIERRERLTLLQTARYARKDPDHVEQEKKKELFGENLGRSVRNFFTGEGNQQEEETPANQLDGLASSLGQTRDALNERGEKLQTLGDKTAALADQSRDFAQMAKELRQNQERGFMSLFD